MTSIEQHLQSRYEQARAALWGKPKVVNIVAEINHRIEQQRREARRKWEREQELKKQQAAEITTFSLDFQVTANFDACDNRAVVDTRNLLPSMEHIARNVLAKHGTSLKKIRLKDNTRAACAARKELVETIHRMRPDKKIAEIARFIHRDHTTALHLLGKLSRQR